MAANSIIEEIENFTRDMMRAYRTLESLVEQLEARENALLARDDSESPQIIQQRREIGEQILRFRIRTEILWASLHTRRADLMTRLSRAPN